MSNTLSKVYVIVAWDNEGKPSIMWTTPTYEQAVEDIQNYLNDDDLTYTIEETGFYSGPTIYIKMED